MGDIYMYDALIIFVAAEWKKNENIFLFQTSELIFNASYRSLHFVVQIKFILKLYFTPIL